MLRALLLSIAVSLLVWALGAVLLVALLSGCHPDGPALVPPPDFAARACPTAPVCSPDMGRDLATVEDARYLLDLAALPDMAH